MVDGDRPFVPGDFEARRGSDERLAVERLGRGDLEIRPERGAQHAVDPQRNGPDRRRFQRDLDIHGSAPLGSRS